jgi:hypothetical protein
MNAKDKIEALAVKVAEDALDPGASAEDRREALKILNPHYTMLLKSKAKSEEDEDDANFDRFTEALSGEHPKAVGKTSGRA